MGSNMVKRLHNAGHSVVGFDLDSAHVQQAVEEGASAANSLEGLIEQLEPRRHIWVMVPHGKPTRDSIESLTGLLQEGDLVIDGGNSNYRESMKNASLCKKHGIEFLDIGVSGGIWGLEIGYNMMVGGSADNFHRIEPALKSLAPENGYAHVGENGAGHFVKMIHNALEYAMLQSIGEAFECLKGSEFDIDLSQVSSLWQHGAVVRSWLLELLTKAFEEDGDALENIAAYVEDSGMGRWTTQFAVENAIPVPTLTQSLYERFASRIDDRFSAKVVAALRNQFGGHAMKQE